MCQLIETPLGTIEYSVVGRGKPLLFLHGGHSNCRETLFHKGFDPNDFQLITPSRPGYRGTPLGSFYGAREAASLIISLLDTIEISSVMVIGISAGGLTAIEMAANYPNRVERLVLISAVTKRWLTKKDPLYKKARVLFSPPRQSYTWAMFRGLFGLAPKSITRMLFNQLSTKESTFITPMEIAEVKEMVFKQSSGKGFVNDLDQDIDSTTLDKITCPTLILHSEHDKSVDISMARHAHSKIPNSRLSTYQNKWGHLLWVGEDSEQPISDVINFIG